MAKVVKYYNSKSALESILYFMQVNFTVARKHFCLTAGTAFFERRKISLFRLKFRLLQFIFKFEAPIILCTLFLALTVSFATAALQSRQTKAEITGR